MNYDKNYFLFIYTFFFDQATGQTRGCIFLRAITQKTKSRKHVPFWGYKTNLILNPYLFPKTVKFCPKTGLVFFHRKRLTVGMLKSKLPLIIIVAP